MTTLNVWCYDRASTVTKQQDTAKELKSLLTRCLSAQHFFSDVQVTFTATKPAAQRSDLVMRFVPSRKETIGVLLSPSLAQLEIPEDTGQTVWNDDFVSSEFNAGSKAKASPVVCAKLVFHEFMHNKLLLGQSLHSHHGLAAAVTNETTPLTSQNIQEMGAALPKFRRAPWLLFPFRGV